MFTHFYFTKIITEDLFLSIFSGFVCKLQLERQVNTMNKRTIAITFFGLVFMGWQIFGSSEVMAHWYGTSNSNLISDLAKKLGIGEDKVKLAFESVQSERQKEKRALFEQRLTQLVKDGKINESQKQAILKKHDELQAKRTVERQELENWAKQNGLDNLYLFGGFGHKGMHGRMME